MHFSGSSSNTVKLAVAATYLFVVALFMTCGCRTETLPTGKAPEKGDRVVMIAAYKDDPQWPGITGAARLYMANYPDLVLETRAPADNRLDSFIAEVESAVATGPRVLCVHVLDSEASLPALEAADRAGISLITMGVEVDFPGVFGQIVEDVPGAAELLGAHLDQIIGDKRSYLASPSRGEAARVRYISERFVNKARGFSTLTLLEEPVEAVGDPAALVNGMFERFPNAGLLVTLEPNLWYENAPGDLLGKNARFATVGSSPVLWKYLISGEATALAGPNDGEIGKQAMKLALGALTEGQKIGTFRLVQARLITRKNLGDFMRQYASSTGLDLNEYNIDGVETTGETGEDHKKP